VRRNDLSEEMEQRTLLIGIRLGDEAFGLPFAGDGNTFQL
jgi:hypothetical protein